MRTNFQLPPHSPPSCSSCRVDYFHFRIRPHARVGFACPFSYSLAEIFSSKHYIFRRDYMYRSVLRLNTFWDVRSFWTKLNILTTSLEWPRTKSCNKASRSRLLIGSWASNDCRYCWQASCGSRRGARPPSPLFLDQTEARRAEKKLLWPPPSPSYPRVYMTSPPSPHLSEGLNLPLQVLHGFPLVGLLYLWLHNLARNRSRRLGPHILD